MAHRTHSITLVLKRVEQGTANHEDYLLLWRRYYERILRAADGMLDDEDSREQIATDAFHAVICDLKEHKLHFENRGPFASVLLKQLRYKFLDILKKRNRKKRNPPSELSDSADAVSSEPSAEELMLVEEFVRQVASQLPKESRSVFHRLLYGLNPEEIASQLSTTDEPLTETEVRMKIEQVRTVCKHLSLVKSDFRAGHPGRPPLGAPQERPLGPKDVKSCVEQLISDAIVHTTGHERAYRP